jgi:Ca2+-binding EF-hand superfamily protein
MLLDKNNSVEVNINLNEFKEFIPEINKFGLDIKDDEIENIFKQIDINEEGSISFDDFCFILIQKSIDLDDAALELRLRWCTGSTEERTAAAS